MDVNWLGIFTPTMPLLEIFVRGTVTYLMLFFLLRLVLRRESGNIKITNVLVIVLIADAIQNGMASDYTSITDGLLLVCTILFWAYTVDWLGYRFPAIQWWVHPPPLLLVKDGKMLRHNMRHELVTVDELMNAMREHDIENILVIKRAYLEGDGQFSFITHQK